jgi:hypothetical protein
MQMSVCISQRAPEASFHSARRFGRLGPPGVGMRRVEGDNTQNRSRRSITDRPLRRLVRPPPIAQPSTRPPATCIGPVGRQVSSPPPALPCPACVFSLFALLANRLPRDPFFSARFVYTYDRSFEVEFR